MFRKQLYVEGLQNPTSPSAFFIKKSPAFFLSSLKACFVSIRIPHPRSFFPLPQKAITAAEAIGPLFSFFVARLFISFCKFFRVYFQPLFSWPVAN